MKLVAVTFLAIAACSGGSNHTQIDSPPVDDAVCKAMLESKLDRSCTTPSDCVLVESEDCCGPIMLGIKSGTEGTFPSKEHDYNVCLACPPLGCAHAPHDEAGHAASGSGQMIVADCVSSKCVSVVR